MRILHIGNTGNLAYELVKFSRRAGLEADLLIREGSEWTADPAREDPELRESRPPWLIYWKRRTPLSMLGLLPKFRGYDVVQAYSGAPAYVQFLGKPYIAYSTGYDLRTLALQSTLGGTLMRRAYVNARVVIFSNPDQLDAIRRLGLRNTRFLPFIIDTDKYAPGAKKAESGPFVIFHPSRLDWKIKGNDVFIRAFAKFAGKRKDAKLVIVDWGADAEKTSGLIRELGIEGRVEKLPLMGKPELVEQYRRADLVLDQLVVGSLGLLANEAMACGKPVVSAINEADFRECYPELPPVINAGREDEILEAMLELEGDRKKLESLGRRSREWVEKYAHWKAVVSALAGLYEEAGGRP